MRKYKSEDEITSHLDKELFKLIKQKKNNIDNDPIVSAISLCYDITELENIDKQRAKLMDKHINDL